MAKEGGHQNADAGISGSIEGAEDESICQVGVA
jgi:hypothetical protein